MIWVRDMIGAKPLRTGRQRQDGPATNDEVSATLHRCLSPDPARRPTAAELRAVLSGRGAGATKTAAKPAATRAAGSGAATRGAAPAGTDAPARTRQPIVADRVALVGEGGRTLQVGVRTELGKHLARQFGGDAEFWDAKQCVLERLPDRRWQVVPNPTATNETLLNGEVLVGPRPVHDGDVLAVGRKAKGIVKLPLTLRAG